MWCSPSGVRVSWRRTPGVLPFLYALEQKVRENSGRKAAGRYQPDGRDTGAGTSARRSFDLVPASGQFYPIMGARVNQVIRRSAVLLERPLEISKVVKNPVQL